MYPETEMNEYIKGFESGCNFIMHEITVIQKKFGNNVPLSTLIDLLEDKKEKKDD